MEIKKIGKSFGNNLKNAEEILSKKSDNKIRIVTFPSINDKKRIIANIDFVDVLGSFNKDDDSTGEPLFANIIIPENFKYAHIIYLAIFGDESSGVSEYAIISNSIKDINTILVDFDYQESQIYAYDLPNRLISTMMFYPYYDSDADKIQFRFVSDWDDNIIYPDSFAGGGNVYDRGKRPSPKESATLYDEGYEMEGQDGNMYRIVVDKNGRHSWKLCKDCEEKNINHKNDNMETEKVKYRAEVTGINENVWSGNAIEYDTIEEAEQYLNNLSMKWFGYDMSRIVPTTTPTRQKVDYDNDMFYQDFRHKESKKNYDRSKIEQAQAVTQQLPERKFHKGDIVKDKNGTNYRVTGELQYNQTFKDYDVLVVDADVPLDKIFKEYIFSEKNLKKYVNTLENQGGEKFEIGKKSEYNIFKGIDYTYDNLFQLNKAIEELIDKKVKYSVLPNGLITIISNSLTSDELVFANSYVGYGGLEKFGATGLGLLYEYYTPDQIIKMMWALAYKYGGDPKSILEPSCATGRFFKYAPKASLITGYEINIYSALICKLLYENAAIYHKYFEQVFLKNNTSLKSKIYELPKYDLVVGNPPYGDISQGASKWFAMGEDKYSHATNYIDYFIFRGIDLLIDGGLLIYVVGAEKHAGGSLFLEKGMNKTKELIAEKADLLDAYKLPAKLFQTTGVSSEIIVLKKK